MKHTEQKTHAISRSIDDLSLMQILGLVTKLLFHKLWRGVLRCLAISPTTLLIIILSGVAIGLFLAYCVWPLLYFGSQNFALQLAADNLSIPALLYACLQCLFGVIFFFNALIGCWILQQALSVDHSEH